MSNNLQWLETIKNSPVAARNQHLIAEKKPKQSKVRKDCKQVIWIKEQLTLLCMDKGYVLSTEYRFFEYRKWRFDFFISKLNCAVEYEGIVSNKSRHTTITGYSGDTDKYRQAALMNIKVLRYTSLNYKNLLKDINAIST